ncbi:MAG: DUF3606 domain-containing protein [Burkholderiaceae bacterium]
MSDDLSKRGPADRARININEPHEIAYWSKALACSEEELRRAVDAVGVMATEVRQHLGTK